jgi:formylglycine-generating enzyme required for sulfatase activity
MKKKLRIAVILTGVALSFSCSFLMNSDAENQNISGSITLSLGWPQVYPSAFSVQWNKLTSQSFAAYRIYYDTVTPITQKSPLAKIAPFITDTTYLFDYVRGGKTYYVKVFAFDGLSYTASNELVVKTPVCSCGIFTGEKQSGMIRIPAGCFQDSGGYNATISHDFYMDTTEITRTQWDHVMGHDTATSLLPQTEVSWYTVILFCNKRSKMGGKDTCYSYSSIYYSPNNPLNIDSLKDFACAFSKNGYRLPTEDEWEYAYRAGTRTDYYWGKDFYSKINPLVTVYPLTVADSQEMNRYAWWLYNNATDQEKNVGRLKPNGWRLYDMAGNVSEMIWDPFSIRPLYNRFNYSGPPGALKDSYRVLRGGEYYSFPEYLTSSFRAIIYPNNPSNFAKGFRTVCTRISGT